MIFLDKAVVSLNGRATTAKDAIRESGGLLVASHAVKESYVEAMVKSFEDNGPYIVLAPHIAVPHARPEDGVTEPSVSLIRYREGISFGHKNNDPVHLVFALGASSSDEHLALLKKLTELLGKKENATKFIEANSYEDLTTLIGGTNQ
ncbi:PTS sugar transporter subunit IIA [Bacillaceae bacterium SIJ1]|uniref:PTS sugar transporter subunit IIA n=1 Tax=Litoribacterium kuwaitense TaxID=1398745 RepID=UPI0013EB2382|nr:PTS sugar transporter subunit IIA [Litoribacterium kuwaitense]NGP46467.1 PTS sugar transporter subunit IIA [Litoribacterium kuwaitense]